jgi:hypothetical protein
MSMDELLIEVGLNEAVSRSEHPDIPITPTEIADDILGCADAGASIVHFHARDPKSGEQRFGATELYRDVVRRVRQAGSSILMYPTYPPFFSDTRRCIEERFAHVFALADEAELEMNLGPLDMGSINLVFAKQGGLSPAEEEMPADRSVYQNSVPILREVGLRMNSLAGKVAIATGSSREIGKGCALELAAAGATVYVSGRTLYESAGQASSRLSGSLATTVSEIEAAGGRGIAVACDYADDDQVADLFARVSRESGRLDVLVNNAI